MSEPIVIQKSPSEIKQYQFDWTDAVGDIITASVWTPAAGLTLTGDIISGDGLSTLITLSGGVNGTNYTLVDTVTYTSGQTGVRTIIVEVRAHVGAISLIDATIGGSVSNSYVTLTAADSYFANQLFADDWFSADTVTRERALMSATLSLERFDYVGRVVDEDTPQALKWPRQLNDSGDLIRNYAINAIPAPVVAATCNEALALIQAGGTTVAGAVESMKIGSSVEIKYASGAVVETSLDYSGLSIDAARHLSGLRIPSFAA